MILDSGLLFLGHPVYSRAYKVSVTVRPGACMTAHI